MSIFNYPIFICFLIFVVWFAYERIKTEKAKKNLENDFWKRESEANFSRRKNLDNISYITIPFESFPMDTYSDDGISEAEETLLSLKDKRCLNITGKTSTDLKLEYGAANLTELNDYDENYITLIKGLQQYGQALYDGGHTDDAASVLEFSVSIGSDLKATYLLLAAIYVSTSSSDKIQELISMAEKLDSLMKPSIINALTDISL